MPCRSDYQDPRGAEKESRDVAKHLVYLLTELKLFIPANVKDAAKAFYGDAAKCDEFTELLCNTINSKYKDEAEAVIYNGRKEKSRALADWWDCHQKFDEKRVADEKLVAERNEVIDSLTPRQREVLNLD